MTTAVVKKLELDDDLKDDDIWRYMHTRSPIKGLEKEIVWSRDRVHELGQPQAVTRCLAVERLDPNGIMLEEDVKLDSPDLLDFFHGADAAVLMGITIGPQVEAEVDRLFAEGQAVRGLVLDAAGSALLHQAGAQIHREAFDEAQRDGLKTGPCLGPGGAFWDLTGQRTLFSALPLERMGLRLLKSCFMSPRKSNTRVLPMGRELEVRFSPDDSHCKYCRAKYCLARR